MSPQQCVTSSVCRNAVILVSACLCLTPLPAFSESMTSMQSLELQQRGQLSLPAAAHKKLNVGLDDQGNVMVSIGAISVTFHRDTTDSSEENLYGSRSNSRQDVASLAAIRVKVGIAF